MDIAILLYEGVTALDAVGPYEVWARLPNANIHFVAKDLKPKDCDSGFLTLLAHYELSEVQHPQVLLIPGSVAGFRSVMQDRKVLDWIVAAHESSQWTTSVCSGSMILGAAGLLRGLKATTHWMALNYLPEFGATATTDRVVQQGKIITAAGVSAGIDMALHLVKHLMGDAFAQAAQLMIEYDPQPPFDSGSVSKAPAEIVKIAKTSFAREMRKQRDSATGLIRSAD